MTRECKIWNREPAKHFWAQHQGGRSNWSAVEATSASLRPTSLVPRGRALSQEGNNSGGRTLGLENLEDCQLSPWKPVRGIAVVGNITCVSLDWDSLDFIYYAQSSGTLTMIMSSKQTIGIHLVLIVLLSSLHIVRQAEAANSCADLVFPNQSSDTIHATVNRSINVTFEVVWTNCPPPADIVFIKIWTKGDMYPTEECKLAHSRNHCSVSTSSSACYCVTATGPVTFSKTFTHVTNVTYTWSWGSDGKHRTIVFIITNYTDGAVNSTHDLNHQTVLIGGLVAGSAMFVFGGIIAGIIVCCRQAMKNQTAQPSMQKDSRPQAYASSSQKHSYSMGPEAEVYDELF